MQQTYRGTLMPRCGFNKVAKHPWTTALFFTKLFKGRKQYHKMTYRKEKEKLGHVHHFKSFGKILWPMKSNMRNFYTIQ